MIEFFLELLQALLRDERLVFVVAGGASGTGGRKDILVLSGFAVFVLSSVIGTFIVIELIVVVGHVRLGLAGEL